MEPTTRNFKNYKRKKAKIVKKKLKMSNNPMKKIRKNPVRTNKNNQTKRKKEK
jgi:hypothetical protein